MSTHQVTLVFEDGRVVKFEASEDDNIYFAALKNKVRILTDCLEGACATCKGVCTSGTYYMDEFTDEALTAEEFDRREVLTCQMEFGAWAIDGRFQDIQPRKEDGGLNYPGKDGDVPLSLSAPGRHATANVPTKRCTILALSSENRLV